MDKAKKDPTISQTEKSRISRRNFVKGAATIAAVAATVPLKPLLGDKDWHTHGVFASRIAVR